MKNNKLLLTIGLIVIAIFARFIPHPPNFSPLLAVALFSGAVLFKNKWFYLVPVVALLISDLYLGFSAITPVVYLSLGLIAVLGLSLKGKTKGLSKSNLMSVGVNSILASVLFFVVSNLGVFLVTGMYPMNFAGLVECFALAIPFFHNTLTSTLMYGYALFGVYSLAIQSSKKVVKI